MASVNTLTIEENGSRNCIIRATQVSDGTNGEIVTVADPTSAASLGNLGVNVGGQIFYPGIYWRLMALDYDVQDMKIRLQWDATAAVDIAPLGSAPEQFNWRKSGGIGIPAGTVGATGKVLIVSVNPQVNATYFLRMYFRKRVPQS